MPNILKPFMIMFVVGQAFINKVGAKSDLVVERASFGSKESAAEASLAENFIRSLQAAPDSCLTSVHFLLDSSGSQTATFNAEKQALKQISDKIYSSPSDPFVGMTYFSIYANTQNPLYTQDQATASSAILAAPHTGGGTKISTGFQKILNQIDSMPRGVDGILQFLIISDFVNDANDKALAEQLLAAILAKGNVVGMCFGVTGADGLDESFMKALCPVEKYREIYPNVEEFAADVANVAALLCNTPTAAPTPAATVPTVPTSSKAPTGTPSAVPSAAPTKVPPAAPPELGLLALTSLLLLLFPGIRRETKKLEGMKPGELQRVVEGTYASTGNPVFMNEAERLDLVEDERPNQIRHKPAAGEEERIKVDKLPGSSMFTSFHVKETGQRSKWDDIKGRTEPRTETRQPEPLPAQTQEPEEDKERKYLASLLIVTLIGLLNREAGMPLPFKRERLPEANITGAINAVKNYFQGAPKATDTKETGDIESQIQKPAASAVAKQTAQMPLPRPPKGKGPSPFSSKS